jgi:hypothetical protein
VRRWLGEMRHAYRILVGNRLLRSRRRWKDNCKHGSSSVNVAGAGSGFKKLGSAAGIGQSV